MFFFLQYFSPAGLKDSSKVRIQGPTRRFIEWGCFFKVWRMLNSDAIHMQRIWNSHGIWTQNQCATCDTRKFRIASRSCWTLETGKTGYVKKTIKEIWAHTGTFEKFKEILEKRDLQKTRKTLNTRDNRKNRKSSCENATVTKKSREFWKDVTFEKI